MAVDIDTTTASLVAHLVCDSATQVQEQWKNISILIDSWSEKQERLTQRLEAHDQCLEHLISQWASSVHLTDVDGIREQILRSDLTAGRSSVQRCTQETSDGEGLPSRTVKFFREEALHATFQGVSTADQTSSHGISTSSLTLGVCSSSHQSLGDSAGFASQESAAKKSASVASTQSSAKTAVKSWLKMLSRVSGSALNKSNARLLEAKDRLQSLRGRVSYHNRYASHWPSDGADKEEQANQERHISEQPLEADNKQSVCKREKLSIAARTTQLELQGKAVPEGLAAYVQHWIFQVFCAGVIVLNMVVILIETEYEASTLESDDIFGHANIALNIWYALEVVVKLVALKGSYFTGPDRKWNLLDAFLVGLSILDFFSMTDWAGNLKMTKSIRAIRFARIVRLIRIFRFMNFALEFQKMILSMANCLATLFWALVVLAFVTFCFGIMLTQVVTVAYRGEEEVSPSESMSTLRSMFKNVPLAAYYLFQSVTSGVNWGTIAAPLFDVDGVGGCLFVCYIFFTFFGVLNVVTSVFVESALQATSHHRELLIKDRMRVKDTYAAHVKAIFQTIDSDGSGLISMEEIDNLFSDIHLRQFIDALEVNATDARMMFKLLDYDGSGQISSEEFVEGCLKLKGEAKSFDVYCLIYENERNLKVTNQFMKTANRALDALSMKMMEVSDVLSNLCFVSNQLAAKETTIMRAFFESSQKTSNLFGKGGHTLSERSGGAIHFDDYGRLASVFPDASCSRTSAEKNFDTLKEGAINDHQFELPPTSGLCIQKPLEAAPCTQELGVLPENSQAIAGVPIGTSFQRRPHQPKEIDPLPVFINWSNQIS